MPVGLPVTRASRLAGMVPRHGCLNGAHGCAARHDAKHRASFEVASLRHRMLRFANLAASELFAGDLIAGAPAIGPWQPGHHRSREQITATPDGNECWFVVLQSFGSIRQPWFRCERALGAW